jgi:hypothetical protein
MASANSPSRDLLLRTIQVIDQECHASITNGGGLPSVALPRQLKLLDQSCASPRADRRPRMVAIASSMYDWYRRRFASVGAAANAANTPSSALTQTAPQSGSAFSK